MNKDTSLALLMGISGILMGIAQLLSKNTDEESKETALALRGMSDGMDTLILTNILGTLDETDLKDMLNTLRNKEGRNN